MIRNKSVKATFSHSYAAYLIVNQTNSMIPAMKFPNPVKTASFIACTLCIGLFLCMTPESGVAQVHMTLEAFAAEFEHYHHVEVHENETFSLFYFDEIEPSSDEEQALARIYTFGEWDGAVRCLYWRWVQPLDHLAVLKEGMDESMTRTDSMTWESPNGQLLYQLKIEDGHCILINSPTK